ncbi:MAG: anthranilate phosphoribosyltransferase [Actinobacteria bacterium]|nr:anthranilate phosphoribosyltransferase [Actinomycetota bacterium]
MLKPLIAKLAEGIDLTEVDVMEAMEHIMCGRASEGQVGAFLAAMRLKGETVDEIVGAARVMRRHATAIRPRVADLVDTCGTGGDASHTFNISTASAFVLAGAGRHVAKHGNRAVSSCCGSADVLEALGVRIEVHPDTVCTCVEEIGVGFLYAPLLHSAMRHVAPIRRDLGIRTVFNLLGPLTNPAGVVHQVVGVSRPDHTRLLAEALLRLGTPRAMVVHGCEGLDEVSLAGPTLVAEVRDGAVTEYMITPEEAGIARAPLESIRGGDAPANAAIVRRILTGEPGPPRDVVLLNAGVALRLSGAARDMREGAGMAADSIDSGRALSALTGLVEATERAGLVDAAL